MGSGEEDGAILAPALDEASDLGSRTRHRTYAERRSTVLPGTLWVARRTAGVPTDVLPDGCMDLVWDGRSLLVAGPDTRPHRVSVTGPRFAAVRFDPGVAPAALGVAAAELRDRRVGLEHVWPPRAVRRWRDALRGGPHALVVLEALAAETCSRRAAPPWVAPTVALLRSGTGVGATARAVALSERELRRRCSAVFGYGPKTLQRVLRVHASRARARWRRRSPPRPRAGRVLSGRRRP